MKLISQEVYYFIVGNKLVPVKAKKSFYRSIGVYGAKAKSLVTKFTLSLKSNADIVRLAELLNQTQHVSARESGL